MAHSSSLSRALAPWVLLGLVHCAPPLQNGGVEFFEGAEARLQTMCKWRRGEGRPESCFAGELGGAPPSRAFVVDDDSVLLRGPYALGRRGDVMLDNGQIAVVIAAVGPSIEPLGGGGVLIDAGDAQLRIDQLSVLAPTVEGSAPPQSATEVSKRGWTAEALELGSGPDGAAWVDVRGHLDGGAAGSIRTRYALAPGQRVLQVSTVTAVGAQHRLGDDVHWGSAVPQRPGPTLDAVGSAVGYSIIPQEPWSTQDGTGAIRRVLTPFAPAKRGENAQTYHRFLAISVRGDSLAIASELAFLSGGALGTLGVGFVDHRGKPLPTPEEGRIELVRRSAPPFQLEVAGARSGEFPLEIEAEAPVGTYAASYHGPGGWSAEPTEVRIVQGEAAQLVLTLQPHGQLALKVSDGGTALASIVSVQTGQIVLSSGAVFGERNVRMPPGRYRVTAERGPEHTRVEREVELSSGRESLVELPLSRSVEPTSRVGCELVRGALFGAESKSFGAQLKARLAAGADCLIVTERGAVADVSPIARSLRAPRLSVLAAVESGASGSRGLGLSLVPARDASARGRWVRLSPLGETASPRHQVAPGLWDVPVSSTGLPSELPTPRLYVDARRDASGRPEPDDLRQALLEGRGAVLTRGPLLRAEMDDVRIGGVVSLDAADHRLRITVERAPWVSLERLEVLVDGDVRLTLPSVEASASESTSFEEEHVVVVSRRAKKENDVGDATPRLVLDSDSAITFLAHGGGDDAGPALMASTAPLWVDVDGDGRSLGRSKKQPSAWRNPKALSD